MVAKRFISKLSPSTGRPQPVIHIVKVRGGVERPPGAMRPVAGTLQPP
jgi:hypothetical protein